MEPSPQRGDSQLKEQRHEVHKWVRHDNRQRFAAAAEARKHAAESVEQGRQYVAAYVELMHYAERLLLNASRARARRPGKG